MVLTEKDCSKCKKLKPANEFYSDKIAKSGLSSQCRSCVKAYANGTAQKIIVDTAIRPIKIEEEQWKEQSNCAGADTDAFFPVNKGAYENKDMLTRICNACPVKAECLDYAVKYDLLGWWGGTTEIQRRRIRAERKVA
jgi:WhiB family redox-sensing transcriptional regulator